jgi:hypothetical protein
MFIALALYGKLAFDDFWAPFPWKLIGSVRVNAILQQSIVQIYLKCHYFSVLNTFKCYF